MHTGSPMCIHADSILFSRLSAELQKQKWNMSRYLSSSSMKLRGLSRRESKISKTPCTPSLRGWFQGRKRFELFHWMGWYMADFPSTIVNRRLGEISADAPEEGWWRSGCRSTSCWFFDHCIEYFGLSLSSLRMRPSLWMCNIIYSCMEWSTGNNDSMLWDLVYAI